MSPVEFIKKSTRFIVRYVFNDPVFVLKYLIAYFRSGYTGDAKFYTEVEFIKEIESGKSLIRIGDGEIGLLHKRDISYQKYDRLLVSKLKELIYSYSESSDYIISIPIFVNYSNLELANTKGKLSCWLPLKVEYFRIFNRGMKYFDAHTFYRKNFFENNIYNYLKDKKLIINTTEQNIQNQKENIEKVFDVIGWIPARAPNPFDLYEDTKNKIEDMIRGSGGSNDVVLILGSGPMSKVLAYDFAQKGVQAIDIGKGFEQLYNDVSYEHEI